MFAGLWSLIWWPWIFWTFGIVLACLCGLSYLVLPAVPLKTVEQGLTFSQKLRQLDLLGASLGITAMILFNFAWNHAPGFGWEQPYIYTLLVVGILLSFAFFWIEIKVSKHPLVSFDAVSTDIVFVILCEMCRRASFGSCSDLSKSQVHTNAVQEFGSSTSFSFCKVFEAHHRCLPWLSFAQSLSLGSLRRSRLVVLSRP